MNFQIEKTMNLLVIAGSHSYGMSTSGSDIDLKGICTAPLDIRLSSYQNFDQYEGSPPEDLAIQACARLNTRGRERGIDWDYYFSDINDSTIYDISKAITLMGNCNPNMLEMLFVDESDIIFSNEVGERLRQERNNFLSLKLKFTYSGYAHAQLKKMQRFRGYLMGDVPQKPERKAYGLPEHRSLLTESESNLINEEIQAILKKWNFDDFEFEPGVKDSIDENLRDFYATTLKVSNNELNYKLEDMAAESLGLSTEVREALDRERKYRAALKNYKSYLRWQNERNPVRKKLEEKFKFDVKHASHLIRLSRTGREILKTGKLMVRRPDAEELVAIRRGEREYEDIIEEASNIEKEMNDLYMTNPASLRKSIDTKHLDSLTREIILYSLR